MAYDFPTNPVDGQVYDDYVYSSSKGGWNVGNAFDIALSRVANIELLSPIGSIHLYAGGQSPQGYVFCQGQALSRTTYASLFNAIGTTYGAGDGSTTFNIPDLQGRVPVGKSASGTFSTLNNKGGAETHTLVTAELPVHTHIQNQHTHTQDAHRHGVLGDVNNAAPQQSASEFSLGPAKAASKYLYTTGVAATNIANTATNQNTGGGGAHNNLQPYNTVNYIIKF